MEHILRYVNVYVEITVEFRVTHNTHAHTQLYVHATVLRIHTMSAAGRLLAAAPKSSRALSLLCS